MQNDILRQSENKCPHKQVLSKKIKKRNKKTVNYLARTYELHTGPLLLLGYRNIDCNLLGQDNGYTQSSGNRKILEKAH
jgi:hypothetical protein